MDPVNPLEQITEQVRASAANVESSKQTADALKTEIEQLKIEATQSKAEATAAADAIKALLERANELTGQIEVSLSTSQDNAQKSTAKFEETKSTLENSITASLGGAFTKKEEDARKRDWAWLAILLLSIMTIYFIANAKYDKVNELIASKTSVELILVQIFLGMATLAAPVWVAWLSTKRLSKIYAISEDYAYKAALAQAYQGYRDSYQGKDEVMLQRLLASIVTHLDASPVRLIDLNHPATPLQDLLQQTWMQELMKNTDNQANLVKWFKERFPSLIPTK